MIRRPPRSTRPYTLFPYTTLFRSWRSGRTYLSTDARSRIEGIGRPLVEPSFQPHVIDRMIEVKDAASFAAARFLSERLGRRVGPSTGTNLIGVIELAEEMAARGEHGSIVSLIFDPGERYLDSAFDSGWRRSEERRVGKEWVGTCRYRWCTKH